MNVGTKFLLSIGLLGLLCLTLPCAAQADTVYTYAGNTYDQAKCVGSYCGGGPYALSITFDTTLTGSALDNLSDADITASVTTFSFTDGIGPADQLLSITPANATPLGDTAFNITTDGSGNIIAWLVYGFDGSANPSGYGTDLYAFSSGGTPAIFAPIDYSEVYSLSDGSIYDFNQGRIESNAGQWAVTDTPEPSSLLLLGTGLLALVGIGWRRSQATSSGSILS